MNKAAKVFIGITLFIFFSSILPKEAFSWDPIVTHRDFSIYAAENSVLSKDKGDYLKNLGFENGLKEKFTWGNDNKKIKDWITKGADLEDSARWWEIIFDARNHNHFHNPLKPWESAGLDDWVLFLHYTGESSLLWAQDGAYQESYREGDWSWKKVREYYYLALTSGTDTERQENFARTFRGLGHQIHHIQDATVPDHVRNDIHFGGLTIEAWAAKELKTLDKLKAFAPNPQFPAMSLDPSQFTLDPSYYDRNLVPSALFLDTDQYDKDNPSDFFTTNLATSLEIGITEYTNANFASPHTIFTEDKPTTDKHYFPYPNKLSTNLQELIDGSSLDVVKYVEAKDGVIESSLYVSKNKDGYGEKIEHFAKPKYTTTGRWSIVGGGYVYKLDFYLDKECHKDYASLLIPRAVGYSAGLLDYFFRGEMEAVNPEAIKDGSDNITGVNLKVRNNTPGESMEPWINPETGLNESKFIVSYRYEKPGDENIYYGVSDGIVLDETIASGSESTSTFTFNFSNSIPSDAQNVKYLLVYRGKLGNEEDAVVGKILGTPYFVVMPVDHDTRELLAKKFYYYSLGFNTLNSVSESDLPFGILDDGAYWDSATSSWTIKGHPDGLGVPLSVGGPQYIAKYWDEANNRVRFVPNLSYEKEAYQAFNRVYKDTSDSVIKDFYNVVFEGSPLLGFGAYEENPGYMEYLGEPYYGLYSLRPKLANDPVERFFSMYRSLNFMDTFLEYDTSKFYYFDETVDVDKQNIPKDADAPFPSVISISKSGDVFNVEIPKIFNYTRPNPYWPGSAGYGSSGVDNYTASIGSSMSPDSSENKCLTEDNNCGNIYDSAQGSSSVDTVYDIPYNFNSFVRVHNNDGGQYFEELFVNGQQINTPSVSTDKLETHYQILAVYKDIAVIRETNFVSYSETPLDYRYTIANNLRIYEYTWDWTAKYYIYVKGVWYDLAGTTNIKSKYLTNVVEEIPSPLPPIVDYLTWEVAEDITGYHLDRIFISDSFDGQYILVAFDEYEYNGGAGLVHSRKYEESDVGDGKYILYYDIPQNELQNADHEATRVGRQLLLFGADGSFKESLQDPISSDPDVGLQDFSIGSIGILN